MDEHREIARFVIEQNGGLEYVRSANFPRAADPEVPCIWNVYLCVLCHIPIWNSTTPGEADGWRIADFDVRAPVLTTCSGCESQLLQMSRSTVHVMTTQAISMLILFWKTRRKENDDV